MKMTVFTKIFAYTMLLLLLMSLAAVLLFARQFLSFYRDEQKRQLSASFQPMIATMSDWDKSPEEIREAARLFAETNQSFKFVIQEGDGRVLFSTTDTEELPVDDNEPVEGLRIRFMGMTRNQGDSPNVGYVLTGYSAVSGPIDYGDLLGRSILALGIMLAIGIFGAVLFAKRVTKPLEDEIVRRHTMEENQRLFFSAASHELKTPIASARALVEGMIANVGEYKNHPKYLRECLTTLDAQAHLVSEILEIAKLSGEDTAPQAVEVNLAELGAAVLAEYMPLAESRALTIEGEFPQVTVKSDRGLLLRVFSNVIANAVQNTAQGGTIRLETEISKSIRFRVLNTGARIPVDVISRLFEPFFRMDTARTRHGSQTGLGLTIVKKALDRLNFPFALENTPEGVLFWMDIPLA